jgi:hypothetical protein
LQVNKKPVKLISDEKAFDRCLAGKIASMKLITLYRPTGLKELELIAEAKWKCFPPRLFWQPIFYPVLNQAYAEQIAYEWNTADELSSYCGIVTAFDLKEDHYLKYYVQNVGGHIHNELWIPSQELDLFNQNIVGNIRVLNVFFGEKFISPQDEALSIFLNKFKPE